MDNSIAIIDNGSGYLKCGFSTHQLPQYIIPNVYGHPKYQNEIFDLPYPKQYYDKKYKRKKNILGEKAL